MRSPFRNALHTLGLSVLLLCAALLTTRHAGAGNAPESKPMRFVVYGDTRDGHDVHRKLVALILKQKPAFVLQTGDLVHNGADNGLWTIYDEITGAMRKELPVYPARGNHDLGGPGYEQRVTAPFSSGNKLYYSFDKGGCHFVSIDSFSPCKPGSKQYTWLEGDLKRAQNRDGHIFVFSHVPAYSIGSHGSDLTVRSVLCPLFQKYGVTAVFNGHDHNYYRTTRDGILYIVAGGGGAPLYPCDPNKGAIPGDKWESTNNIVICDVDGTDIKVTALRADGSTIDKFSL